MNVNHLDARAFAQPGGAFAGITAALDAILNGYQNTQDRREQRGFETQQFTTRANRDQQILDHQNEESAIQDARNGAVAPGEQRPRVLAAAQAYAREQGQTALDRALAQAQHGIAPFESPYLLPGDRANLTMEAARRRNAQEAAAGADIAEKQARANMYQSHGSLYDAKADGDATAPGLTRPTAATLRAAHELAETEAAARGAITYDVNGHRQIADPKAYNQILRESYRLHGVKVPASWEQPEQPTPEAPATPQVPFTPPDIRQGFLTLRPSGAPGGPQTIGDVLGGRWWGQGEGSLPQVPFTPGPAGPVVERPAFMGRRLDPVVEGTARHTLQSGALSPDQQQRLTTHLQAAQAGDPQAIDALSAWAQGQP